MIEKIVHRRIYDHLTEYDILNKRQSGFRPGHSTAKTYAYFTEDLYTAINNKETTIAVFIDAANAFDTVNHEILIKKLQKIGIVDLCCNGLKIICLIGSNVRLPKTLSHHIVI